jgi:hypothetical protein
VGLGVGLGEGVGLGDGVGVMVGSTVGVPVGAAVGSNVGVGPRLAEAVGVGVFSVELGPAEGCAVGVGRRPVGEAVGPGAGGRLSRMKIVAPTRTISRNARVAARTCAARGFTGAFAPLG